MSLLDDLKDFTVGKLQIIKEFFVGKSLSSLGTPQGAEIESLGRANHRYPRAFSVICEFENRLNDLTGVLAVNGEPLYPRYTYFNKQADRYLRVTPSVLQKRAEMLTDILKSGALNPPQQQQRTMDLSSLGDNAKLEPAPSTKRYD